MLNVLLGNLSAPERTFDLLKKKTKRLNGFALSLASPIRKKKTVTLQPIQQRVVKVPTPRACRNPAQAKQAFFFLRHPLGPHLLPPFVSQKTNELAVLLLVSLFVVYSTPRAMRIIKGNRIRKSISPLQGGRVPTVTSLRR